VYKERTSISSKMTSDIIINKVDFQRHLNGCERRLNDLTKSLQNIEKFSQKLLLNSTCEDQQIYFKELNRIQSEMKFLYASLLTLNQSSFAFNGRKRLDLFKQNFEKNRIKFQQIQQYAQIKFGYEYQEESFEQNNNEQQEQLTKLLEKNYHDEQIELDLIHQHSMIVNHLEKDLNDLQGTFIDLNRLIHEQGTMVDNIEQALTSTDELVHEAAEHVKTTVKIKKRTKRLKWILISFFICLIILIIIIIYFTLKLAIPYG
jgi:uncharacterized protein YoxC